MRRNWESGPFWVDYAMRRSWAFNAVFWTFLDPAFFGGNGKRDEYEERLALLDEEARNGIDAFVQRKVKESQKRELRERGESKVENLL